MSEPAERAGPERPFEQTTPLVDHPEGMVGQ